MPILKPELRPRVALITSSPALVQSFLGDDALRGRLGIDIPLAIHVQRSTRLADRGRDLHRTILRRARINGISPWLQLLHYFAYRWVVGRRLSKSPEHAVEALGAGRRLLEVRSANEPAVVSALRAERCALGIVVSGDVLSRRTLEALDVPLFNVHLSDPAFVRGMPPVFWEILGGQDSIRLTLHSLTSQVDGGPIVGQREIPIVWQSTLAGTISQTLGRCAREIALLLADCLPPVLDGSAKPRSGTTGPLRTTPTIRQMWRAGRICRDRARASR